MRLFNPAFYKMGTTATNDLGSDGFTWPNTPLLVVDKFGILITFVQRNNGGSQRLVPVVCSGQTWSEPTRSGMFDANGEGFLVRMALAYDATNDILHSLSTDESSLVVYRRYTFTRTGNSITTVTRSASVNIVLDTSVSTNPLCLWIPEGGSFGSVICAWNATNSGGSPNKNEFRATMRALTNDANDNTAGNWKVVGTTGTNTISSAPAVAYTAIATSTVQTSSAVALYRKQAGTNVSDLYAAWYTGTTTAGWKCARLQWNSGASDWTTGQTATQTLSNTVIAGSDTGYSLKYQLLTKWAEDTTNDRMYIGFPIWLSNGSGDTVSFRSVDASSSDALGTRVDVYSAGGSHSFAPCIDIMFDNTAHQLVVSYIKTTTQFAFIQTFLNATAVQAETLLFQDTTFDIPVLSDVRVSNSLACASRSATGAAPYIGYFGLMRWTNDDLVFAQPTRPAAFRPGLAR